MHLHMEFFVLKCFYVSYKPVFEDYVDVARRERETHAKIWRYDDTSIYKEENIKINDNNKLSIKTKPKQQQHEQIKHQNKFDIKQRNEMNRLTH